MHAVAKLCTGRQCPRVSRHGLHHVAEVHRLRGVSCPAPPVGARRDSILSGAAFRILSGAAAPAPDEIYVEFFRAVPPAGQGRSRARIPPAPRAARRTISITRLRVLVLAFAAKSLKPQQQKPKTSKLSA